MWTECIYVYKRQELQNIRERSLWNCFGQFLYIHKKIEYETEKDVDKHDEHDAHGICMH